MSTYRKAQTAKATVGEASGLAQAAALPAIVGARFALVLSGLSVILSTLALAVALWRRS